MGLTSKNNIKAINLKIPRLVVLFNSALRPIARNMQGKFGVDVHRSKE